MPINAGRFSRRRLLTGVGLTAGAVMLAGPLHSGRVRAQAGRVDPYIGTIPLSFPLAEGSYEAPVNNNWHASRQGDRYPWTHHNGEAIRAHDGVDIYPLAGEPLPVVYAPFAGRVAAVGVRAANRLDLPISYAESRQTPPPWNYSAAVDAVDGVPLYGNFIWLVSAEPESAGYFVLLAHLQFEPLIAALLPDQPVRTATRLGLLGDTGNAAGSPQLHVEIHYPAGETFFCAGCAPVAAHTAIDPYASLVGATLRSA